MDEEMPLEEGTATGPGANKKLLAIIAIVVVVGLVAIIFVPMLLQPFGIESLLGIGAKEPLKMLVIGQASPGLITDLDNQRDLVYGGF